MTSNASSSLKLKREAIAWHARLSAPDATGEDWSAFTDWLEANPEGSEYYDDVEALSRDMRTSYTTVMAAGDKGSIDATEPGRNAHNVTVLKRLTKAPRPVWAWLAAAAAVGVAIMIVPNLRDQFASKPVYAWQDYSTAAGQREEITLADGSIVTLNSGSRISVAMDAHERLVKLHDSEAFFSVTHDADRPFVVDTERAQVRVLGTQFNVFSANGRLEVGVQEGRVEVSVGEADDAKFVLTPGKELVRAVEGGKAEVRDIDVSTAFSWKQGSLIYDEVALSDIVLDVNRNFARPLVLADDVDASMRFSGVLALTSEEDVIRALVAFLPLEAEVADAQVTLHARR
jgi:transmembrane sensor